MRRRTTTARRSSGFTLIELLVVLGILVLLAAIILPVFASTRKRAQQSACVGNMRQLYLACSLYSQDNSGLLPPYPSRATDVSGDLTGSKPLVCVDDSSQLLASLTPYIHSQDVWRCPGDSSRPVPGETVGCGTRGIPFPDLTSYVYEGYHLVDDGIVPIRLDYASATRESSTRVVLSDDFNCVMNSDDEANPRYAKYNHGGRWNRIWLDGHATSFGIDCTNSPMIIETP